MTEEEQKETEGTGVEVGTGMSSISVELPAKLKMDTRAKLKEDHIKSFNVFLIAVLKAYCENDNDFRKWFFKVQRKIGKMTELGFDEQNFQWRRKKRVEETFELDEDFASEMLDMIEKGGLDDEDF